MNKDTKQSSAKELRECAEEIHKNRKARQKVVLDEPDILKLVHELEVHQIELELQNEELLKAKQVAREAADKYTELYDFAPTGFFTLNSEGVILNLNLSGSALLEKDRLMLINKNFKLFVSPANRQHFSDFLGKVFSSDKKINCEIPLSIGAQEPKHILLSGIVIEMRDKCHVTSVDVSKRKANEEAIRSSQQIIEGILNAIPARVFWKDRNLNYLGCNMAFAKDAGFAIPREIIGKDDFQLSWRDRAGQYQADDLQVIKTGNDKVNIEEMLTTAGGKAIALLTNKVALKNANGEVTGVLGTFMDITERKQAQRALEESEERMRLAVAGSPIPIMIHDEDGKVLQLSKGWTKYSGYTILDIPTLDDWTEKAYGSRKGTEKDYIDKLFEINETVYNGEWNIKAKDGSVRIWEFQTTPLGKVYSGKRVLQSMAVDITDRKQIEKNLIKAKERAEESDRLKSAFLANMSHEIRTPMNGILGFAELLRESGISGHQQQDFINAIQKSGKRMLNIINNIVDISKIESGQMEVVVNQSDVNEQLKNLHTFFKPEADQKGINFTIGSLLKNGQSVVNTDAAKLDAILTNLLKNAVKYTDKGFIEFGVSTNSTSNLNADSGPVATEQGRNNELKFYVKDSGIGVPEEKKQVIFDRFVQADIEDKKAKQGAGLGLSISKAYIEMLGGEIWLESQEGLGSTFYFTIPSHQKPFQKKRQKRIDGVMEPLMEIKPLTILVVEDDEISELLLRFILKSVCKEYLTVKSGLAAIETCRSRRDIDLVLMDIQLPELDGYDTVKQIRQFNKEIIIIAQTAFGLVGDKEKAIEAGCNDYIPKPVNSDLLKEMIKDLIQKRIAN